MSSASRNGCQNVMMAAASPMRMRSVRAARSAAMISGLGSISRPQMLKWCSASQKLSKPACSQNRASSRTSSRMSP